MAGAGTAPTLVLRLGPAPATCAPGTVTRHHAKRSAAIARSNVKRLSRGAKNARSRRATAAQGRTPARGCRSGRRRREKQLNQCPRAEKHYGYPCNPPKDRSESPQTGQRSTGAAGKRACRQSASEVGHGEKMIMQHVSRPTDGQNAAIEYRCLWNTSGKRRQSMGKGRTQAGTGGRAEPDAGVACVRFCICGCRVFNFRSPP